MQSGLETLVEVQFYERVPACGERQRDGDELIEVIDVGGPIRRVVREFRVHPYGLER